MKKAIIILTLCAFFLFATSLSTAQASWDNEENMLLDNIQNINDRLNVLNSKVESNGNEISGLQDNISSLETKLTVLNSKVNDLDNKISSLSADIDSLENTFPELENTLASFKENTLSNLTDFKATLRENIKSRLNSFENRIENDLSGLAGSVGSFENSISTNEEQIKINDMVLKDHSSDIDNLKSDPKNTVGVILGALAFLGLLGLGYAIYDGRLAGYIPETGRSPKDRIKSAQALLDHRLENEAPPEEIDAARTKLDTLKQRYPDAWKEVESEESIFSGLKEKVKGGKEEKVEKEPEKPDEGRRTEEKTESSEEEKLGEPEEGEEGENEIDSGLPDVGIEYSQESEDSESNRDLPNSGD